MWEKDKACESHMLKWVSVPLILVESFRAGGGPEEKSITIWAP